jgi:hypothetical protein
MTHQDYLHEFEIFMNETYQKNIPQSTSGTKGQISALKSYLQDMKNKVFVINDALKQKANAILTAAEKMGNIEVMTLRSDILQMASKRHDQWMKEYKP